MELVTGYRGVVHVTAAQDSDLQRGLGGDKYRLRVGSKMEVEAASASAVTVRDGVCVAYGREFYIEYGDSSLVNIAANSAGTYRNDIVCLRYDRDIDTGVETGSLEVVQGTAGSAGADPAVADNDIRTGSTTSLIPLARVKLSGAAISGVDMLIDEVSSLADLDGDVAEINQAIKELNTAIDKANSTIAKYLPLAGGTLTGKLSIAAGITPLAQLTRQGSSGAARLAMTSWSGKEISLEIGTSGENRGVYDLSEGKWLVYADTDGNPHLGPSTIGSVTQPIYLRNGIPTAARKYGFTNIGDGWYEQGGWVFCNGIYGMAVTDLKTVPQGYRPYKHEGFAVVVRNNSKYYLGAVGITTGGEVSVYYYPTYGGSATNISTNGNFEMFGLIHFCANLS